MPGRGRIMSAPVWSMRRCCGPKMKRAACTCAFSAKFRVWAGGGQPLGMGPPGIR